MLRSRTLYSESCRALAVLTAFWLLDGRTKTALAAGFEQSSTDTWLADAMTPNDDPVIGPELDRKPEIQSDYQAEPATEEMPADSYLAEDEELLLEDSDGGAYAGEAWDWQWLPDGLIYHPYWAGVHEPRMGLVTFGELTESRTLMDATLGGRVGFLRFGNHDPTRPVGYQLDFYGAAIARLDVENRQDLDSCDYVFGLPLTWGDEIVQYECGYGHISSHLGDEFAISNPGSLGARTNYVRDSIDFGISYYPVAYCRTYGELSWAFHRSGGAGPVHLQIGTELSRPGPTFGAFIPFLAVNGRLRDDVEFGGDINLQVGYLKRGLLGQTLRVGFQGYTGDSSQFQFVRNAESQIGIGLWYDY